MLSFAFRECEAFPSQLVMEKIILSEDEAILLSKHTQSVLLMPLILNRGWGDFRGSTDLTFFTDLIFKSRLISAAVPTMIVSTGSNGSSFQLVGRLSPSSLNKAGAMRVAKIDMNPDWIASTVAGGIPAAVSF